MSGSKYQQVADAILAKIAAGEVSVEITIGGIQELTGATNHTARAAAKKLVSVGVLDGHQGIPYVVQVTPEEAAAIRLDSRPLGDQVAELRQEVDDLRERIGRMDAQITAALPQSHGGNRDQANAATGGRRR